MDERRAAIQAWKKIQPERILLGVAVTAAVVLALWLTVGREEPPAPAATATPEVGADLDGGVETILLWKGAEGIADFSGAIVNADLGAGTVTLDLRRGSTSPNSRCGIVGTRRRWTASSPRRRTGAVRRYVRSPWRGTWRWR